MASPVAIAVPSLQASAAYEFTLVVESAKFLPGDCDRQVRLRWYYSDDCHGESPDTPVTGDEAAFLCTSKFVAATVGASIPHLLQLSIVSASGSALYGVLMIDLNAHVPKPPAKVSRQRATLTMSRCQGAQPMLLRLMMEGSPIAMTAASVGAAVSALASASSSRSLVSTAKAHPGAAIAASGQVGSPLDPAQMLKLRALIATLTAANDQLKDENATLRRGAREARLEPDYTFSPSDARQQGRSGAAVIEQLRREIEDSLAEKTTLLAEAAVMQKGLSNAKDQLRAAMGREEEGKRELAALQKRNAFLVEEVDRLEKSIESHKEASRRHADVSESAALNDMLQSSQQINRDLRAMLASADTVAESLKRELKTAQKEARDADARSFESSQHAERRCGDLELRLVKTEAALRLGQRELSKLHRYAAEVHGVATKLQAELNKERTAHVLARRKLADFIALHQSTTLAMENAPR